MLTQLLLGAVMITVTVIIHAFVIDHMMHNLMRIVERAKRTIFRYWRMMTLVVIILGIFLANIVQIWVWAALYFVLEPEALQDFSTALYFSTSTFTTVGYGDIVLSSDWRLLGSVQSANGMILFGWSTAFIFEVTARLYGKDGVTK